MVSALSSTISSCTGNGGGTRSQEPISSSVTVTLNTDTDIIDHGGRGHEEAHHEQDIQNNNNNHHHNHIHVENSFESQLSQSHSNSSSSDSQSQPHAHDCVKYRKGIRLIAVIDFCLAFTMLFLLSFGFFRVRLDATGDKSVQAFILAMYGLYSIQILVSIILYKGTHKSSPTIVTRSFKQWSTTSNFLNVMLCAEVYFFILIVEGRTMISMSLCFLKVIFRGISIQIVNYSIREMQTAEGGAGTGNGHHGSSYLHDDFMSSSMLLSTQDSITFDSSTISTSMPPSHTAAMAMAAAAAAEFKVPPPAYEAPPKYEEAIKMINEITEHERR